MRLKAALERQRTAASVRKKPQVSWQYLDEKLGGLLAVPGLNILLWAVIAIAGLILLLVGFAIFPVLSAGSVLLGIGNRRMRMRPAVHVTGWLGWLIAWAAFTGDDVYVPSDSYNSGHDSRAYEELRDRGFSESEAREMAPSISRLCRETGGTDC